MNDINILMDFLIDYFNQDPLVNTITTLYTDGGIDVNKENIYPLVNLDLISSTVLFPDADMLSVNFLITIVSQRDIQPQVTDNKLLINTNWRDNINETHAIGSRLISKLLRQNNDLNISLESYGGITFFSDDFIDGLDGCRFDLSFLIRNNTFVC